MATLTIELPDSLIQQVSARKIPKQRLESAIIEFVALYLKESGDASQSSGIAWSDPHEFARRVIADNRELFEKLARLP